MRRGEERRGEERRGEARRGEERRGDVLPQRVTSGEPYPELGLTVDEEGTKGKEIVWLW